MSTVVSVASRSGASSLSGGPDWHAQPIAAVAAAADADDARGLEPREAAARLAHDGPNAIGGRRVEPWWEEVLESLREPLQLLLIAVAVAYFLLGELEDALTILAVIVVVSGIEAINEVRAHRAVAALSTLGAPTATVVRGGEPAELPTAELVRGDLVLLGPGDRVPADLRLTDSAGLRIDESSLTGESAAVAKDAAASIDPGAELGDRRTMAYSSTLVAAGKGRGLVVAVGRSTELGRIATMAETGREPATPLQRSMRELAGAILWLAIAFSVLVPVLGVVVAGLPPQDMLLTGLTLAFATIPEELPILITIVIGIGAVRLARRNAIVKRLRAAETLGSVSVVATDKTGTLTENRMTVAEILLDGRQLRWPDIKRDPSIDRLLAAGVLANDAQVARSDGHATFVGDPTDTAFLAAATDLGLDVGTVRQASTELLELPFDDVRKRMSVVTVRGGRRVVSTKGSPETVLTVCTTVLVDGRSVPLDEAARERLLGEAEVMATRGRRVLALADREVPHAATDGSNDLERDLTLLGLVGLEDPPRAEARAAVGSLRDAGIGVFMLTGDHPMTATAIAERVGIEPATAVRGRDLDALDDDALERLVDASRVFARITAEHKLRIVRALQARDEVVAVTGDGVNDAPALREAAIGVAMGRAGTDVAREAADLVLADDNLATVTAAVEAGRLLFANLSKAVRFYLAAKVGLVLASLVAVLLRLPVPFEPVQIILMELFMDVGASVTFVSEPPEDDVMGQPPRDRRRPLLDRSMRLGILAGGLSLGAAVLLPYLWSWQRGTDVATAQTAAFAAWMIGSVVLAGHMRAARTPLLPGGLLSNRAFVVWALAAIVTMALGMGVPALSQRLHLVPLDGTTWAVIIAAAVLIPSWWEVWKRARARAPSDQARHGAEEPPK